MIPTLVPNFYCLLKIDKSKIDVTDSHFQSCLNQIVDEIYEQKLQYCYGCNWDRTQNSFRLFDINWIRFHQEHCKFDRFDSQYYTKAIKELITRQSIETFWINSDFDEFKSYFSAVFNGRSWNERF